MDLRELSDFALEESQRAGNSDTEVIFSVSHVRESAIEGSQLKLNKIMDYSPAGIRVIRNGAMGFSSTNVLSKDGIRRCIDRATSIARVVPADRSNIIPAGDRVDGLEGINDIKVRDIESSDLVEMSSSVIETVNNLDGRIKIGGKIAAADWQTMIVNSNGVRALQEATLISWEFMGMAVGTDTVSSFDVSVGSSHYRKDADPYTGLHDMAESVVGSLNAGKVESFTGSMIMRPDAFSDIILHPLVDSVCASSVMRGRSALKGRIGEQIGPDNLTVMDDGLYRDGRLASAFDREGTPHRKVTVVEDGILKAFLHSSYTANRFKTENTGNSVGNAGSLPRNGPTNIIVGEGSEKLESIIGDTSRGIIVNRFSGNVNSFSGDFSGVVKCGYFVRNGEIVSPVKEVMVAGNVFDQIKAISGISRETRNINGIKAPYVRTDGVSITG